MISRAMREKKPVFPNDALNDPQVLFGRQYAELGARSMVILPLIVAGETIGSLVLYAGEVDFFQNEELNLLTEMATNIAFAVDHIEKQSKLDYLAYYDALTGLANHALFAERVAQHITIAAREKHGLGIYLLDLERLGNINEIFGQAGMTASTAGHTLVKSIISMAHSLNLIVVAEGVETEEQSKLLLALKCDQIQGFLFSAAVPGDIFQKRFLRPLATDTKE